jgi:hypothetical protein
MAKANHTWPLIGAWAFFIGLVLAIGAGVFAPQNPMITLVLGLMGLVIGVVNVNGKETVEFLVATIAFTVAAGSFSGVIAGLESAVGFAWFGFTLPSILAYFVAVIAPAAAVVSLKAIYEVANSA